MVFTDLIFRFFIDVAKFKKVFLDFNEGKFVFLWGKTIKKFLEIAFDSYWVLLMIFILCSIAE